MIMKYEVGNYWLEEEEWNKFDKWLNEIEIDFMENDEIDKLVEKFRKLGKSESNSQETKSEDLVGTANRKDNQAYKKSDSSPDNIQTKGCRKYFKPFGEDEVETAWKCGDEWNGEKLFCNECVKGEKDE